MFQLNRAILIVCSCRPLFLSFTRVFSILPFTSGEGTIGDCTTVEGANLVDWARSLVQKYRLLEKSPAKSCFFVYDCFFVRAYWEFLH